MVGLCLFKKLRDGVTCIGRVSEVLMHLCAAAVYVKDCQVIHWWLQEWSSVDAKCKDWWLSIITKLVDVAMC